MDNLFFRHRMIFTFFVFVSLFIVVGCESNTVSSDSETDSALQSEYMYQNQPYLINPEEIRSGGPPPDGIPSIDEPEFVSVDAADEWIADNELVLALEYEGETRAYPLQILVWHEIVNDVIAGDHLAITYCPLCGSGIAYKAYIKGEPVEFGTSGSLYNSNLLMYDRASCGAKESVDIFDSNCSLWTQIDGLAIKGQFIGTELEAVDLDTVVWSEWKEFHPSALVLSQNTGYDREYGRDPYGTYYENDFLIFPVNVEADRRLHPKDVVYGIEVNGQFIAYRDLDLDIDEPVEHEVGGEIIAVRKNVDGTVDITDSSGVIIPKERDFWFAWYAFHPDTLLYGYDE